MKKTIASIMVASLMALTLAGCGGGDMNANNESSSSQAEDGGAVASQTAPDGATYESILADYTQKLKDATPGLVEQFKNEGQELVGNDDELALLADQKIFELAKISNEGMQEMAVVMSANGDESEAYQEWADQLNEAYLTQAQDITNAYNEMAVGNSTAGQEGEGGESQE